MTPRLKTDIYLAAYIRRCQSAGAFAVIVQKGDPDAGIVAIKLYTGGRHAQGFLQTRDESGALAWRDLSGGLIDEAQVDTLLEKELKFDPDLWIVEVEDLQGRHFLEETIIPRQGS